MSIEDCAELAIRGLEVYVHGNEKRLMQVARENKIDGLEAVLMDLEGCFDEIKEREKRLEDWQKKVLQG